MWIYFVIGLILVIVIVDIAIASDDSSYKRSKRKITHAKSVTDRTEIKRAGINGEREVFQYLNKLIKVYGGYLFNDFCFEDAGGYSSEIDHILITRGGVFVIETKNNSGTIYGNKDDQNWVSKKEHYPDKKFRNPIIQNQGHINHLRKMFQKAPPKMISMVIFPSADISNIDSNIVYDIESAIAFIKESIMANNYSEEFVNKIYTILRDIKNTHGISKEKHLQNIKNHHY